MKIYILPVDKELQPHKQPFKYPKHNNFYGVEQDFYAFLTTHRQLLTTDENKADWHYLPIYWTRRHHNKGTSNAALKELQEKVDKIIVNSKKTFTICQYDDGPMVKLGKGQVFLSSRKSYVGLDIPLLSATHRFPLFKQSKKYLASFVGRFSTHPIRQRMAEKLSNRPGLFIKDGEISEGDFVKLILRSYVSLCPRGYGGSSFRFFESLQLGVVPLMIGNVDTRPFKEFIDWNAISFFARDENSALAILEKANLKQLLNMGQRALSFYRSDLDYGKWCKYVIMELKRRQSQ